MNATVHVLHNAQPIAHFVRVGYNNHKWLEDRLACGQLPNKRFVFDAAHLVNQKPLLDALIAAGREVVLDPNFAELSSIGRHASKAAALPWAIEGRPWGKDDFNNQSNRNIALRIAEFAVSNRFDAVLSPTHLETEDSIWRNEEIDLLFSLRQALDSLGGNDIGIDYQLITTAALLRDPEYREQAVSDLGNLSVDFLWIRASGFDLHATGTGTKRYIEAVRDFHELSYPIVADMTGGYAAIGAAAFGAISGFSGGVAQKEAFRSSDYLKVPTGGGGGTGSRIYLPELDRFVSEAQLNEILSARGAKTKLLCNDDGCCGGGRGNMIENYKSHHMAQRQKAVDTLSRIPDSRKASHFLISMLSPAEKVANSLSKLKTIDEVSQGLILKQKKRLGLMREALSAKYDEDPNDVARSSMVHFRGNRRGINIIAKKD